MKNKILITGSTGFVGRHLVPELTYKGYEVLEITRSKNKSIELFGDATSKVEVNDFKFEQKIIDFNPEIIIHLASYLTSSDEFKCLFITFTISLCRFNESVLFLRLCSI